MKSLIEYLNFLAARISFLGLYSKESVGDWSRKILIILEAVVKVMNQKILTSSLLNMAPTIYHRKGIQTPHYIHYSSSHHHCLTFSAFSRCAKLREGDFQVLVGRKTEPLPVVTYPEFLGVELKSVASGMITRMYQKISHCNFLKLQ